LRSSFSLILSASSFWLKSGGCECCKWYFSPFVDLSFDLFLVQSQCLHLATLPCSVFQNNTTNQLVQTFICIRNSKSIIKLLLIFSRFFPLFGHLKRESGKNGEKNGKTGNGDDLGVCVLAVLGRQCAIGNRSG
jgi:hypothetical protein